MQRQRFGNKIIDMDRVVYIEFLETIDVYILRLDVVSPLEPDGEGVVESTETLVSIFLEEQDEIEPFEKWLVDNGLKPNELTRID